ncbi:hypothetical protein Vretifemale_13365 [Volvox reticuliferus]|uniref:FAS1 domain-containing protein n=2 Tax=Volvox reticuliferus TaxID=1737510 RepID=A0A8J4CMM6_9CHLO|nr:hypothetical protein Vretifemale_13365 [Volvox reticuliferus]
MRHPTLVFLIGLCILPAAVYADSSVFETLQTVGNTMFLKLALTFANISDTFKNSSLNITLFAPSDTAFLGVLDLLKLSSQDLQRSAPAMAPMLLYHAIKPAVYSSGFIEGGLTSWPNAFELQVPQLAVIPSSDGSIITVRSPGTDAKVTTANITANGSVIHVIDNVLLPFFPSASAAIARDPSLTALYSAVSQMAPELLGQLGVTAEVTVFAPLNGASTTSLSKGSSLLQQKLLTTKLGMNYLFKYHIVPKTATQGVIFNSTLSVTKTVTTLTGLTLKLVPADGKFVVVFPSGNASIAGSYPVGFNTDASFRAVVYLVDQVLIPPSVTALADVVAIKADGGKFVAALVASSAYSSLPTNSSFQGTILVPKDTAVSAFLTSKSITFEGLAKSPTGLKEVLDAHVIQGKVVSLSTVTNGTQLTTASGSKVNVTVDNAGVVYFKSGNVTAIAEYEVDVASTGTGATAIYINAVLFAGTPTTVTTDGGGGYLVGPSPLAMLLCSIFAATLLHLFGRQ